jgi:hypothetical protein
MRSGSGGGEKERREDERREALENFWGLHIFGKLWRAPFGGRGAELTCGRVRGSGRIFVAKAIVTHARPDVTVYRSPAADAPETDADARLTTPARGGETLKRSPSLPK